MERGRIQGLPKFLGTPYYPRNGKSYGLQMDFKFGGYIYRAYANKSTLESFGEKGAWAYSGTAQIFWVPLLSQERVKLRTSNYVEHS